MSKLRDWNPTIALWAGNAVAWPSLALLIAYQFGLFDLGVTGLPKLQSLSPAPIRLSGQLPESGARNPFDPAGSPWSPAVATASAPGGELRGIIIMPGVSVAVTGGGVVRVGGQLAGGRVKEIRANKIIVQRDAEIVELNLGLANRPTMQSLGRGRGRQSGEVPPEKVGP